MSFNVSTGNKQLPAKDFALAVHNLKLPEDHQGIGLEDTFEKAKSGLVLLFTSMSLGDNPEVTPTYSGSINGHTFQQDYNGQHHEGFQMGTYVSKSLEYDLPAEESPTQDDVTLSAKE